jgi:hypothetical protein
MKHRSWLIVLILCLLAAVVPSASHANGPENLLENGDFSGGTHLWQGTPEISLPEGWNYFDWDKDKRPDGRRAVRPEIKSNVSWEFPDGTSPTLTKGFTTFAQHRFSIGQEVDVTPGAVYLLEARVWAWSSAGDDPWVSSPGGSYRTSIGVEQNGELTWSTPPPGLKATDEWIHHELTFTAETSSITVFFCGDAEWAVKHNDSYWDWMRLSRLESPKKPIVPALYQMFDYGTDFHLGVPVGSVHFYTWEELNPARGTYNWKPIEENLAKERELTVTLSTGEVVQKPIILKIHNYLSSAYAWDAATFYDATPRWVYSRDYAVIDGHRVGHVLHGCGTIAVVPAFDDAMWRAAWYEMIRALGAKYDSDPQIVAIVATTGLDGETQLIKNSNCNWNAAVDQQVGGLRYRFGQYTEKTLRVYNEAFPSTTVFIDHAPGGSGMRKAIAELAVSLEPPAGLKHSGMWMDVDCHQGHGSFTGSWDMMRKYSTTVPIWIESAYGFGNKEQKYWSWLAGMHYHPDAIDVHPEWLRETDPGMLQFVATHLGVDLYTTPSVWTVLRDAEYPLDEWGSGGCSGKIGDWQFWLYRQDGPDGSAPRLSREALPEDIRDSMYARQVRYTAEKYIYFDIEDAFAHKNQYEIAVLAADYGKDTLTLEYKNKKGDLIAKSMRKGGTNTWREFTWLVKDAAFQNELHGSDFRVASGGDGDEFVHRVAVRSASSAPTPTPTKSPTKTATPTRTATPLPSPTPTRTTREMLEDIEETVNDIWATLNAIVQWLREL